MKDKFIERHLGSKELEISKMLKRTGVSNLDELISDTIPDSIRLKKPIKDNQDVISEDQFLLHLKEIASKNKIFKNYIGLGYYGTVLPPVIQRNILENPAWYTSYTPYQAEISQGRLEALLNFQTVISDLTGMEISNASLLDEGSAAAEAMAMLFNLRSREAVKNNVNKFFIDRNVFPQSIDIVKTRASALNIEIVEGEYKDIFSDDSFFGVLIQYPDQYGNINDYSSFVKKLHDQDIKVAVIADLMSLLLLNPPGEWNADVVLGSAQRFGLPMSYGGPHAAYFATREKYKRNIPGRIIGVSVDRMGNNALRMALQTREQHIRREKATSNICTAQALLATMAAMYAVYHGPDGLKKIAERIHALALTLSEKLINLGYIQQNECFFDTLKIELPEGIESVMVEKIALERDINLRYIDKNNIGISIDETTTKEDLDKIVEVFSIVANKKYVRIEQISTEACIKNNFKRKSAVLQGEVFNSYHSETEMMRYINRLAQKDFSLVHSMIPLGSCTMKLNAAVEMLPITWPEFTNIHPFAPLEQAEGYHELIHKLSNYLKKVTGFSEISFQPNSGATGEYTGLMVIRKYHIAKGQGHRNIVLIPASAHGTNPASAISAGMKVAIVDCDESGNINIESLRKLAEEHKDDLAAFMVTYPSTHGVFEDDILEMNKIVHENGGLVYMDGANLNAQLGLTTPVKTGADVCHLNLHKTFAIPHGGGGPGMGPIGVTDQLIEYLPTHVLSETGGKNGIGAVAAAPYGSAGILPISYAYCRLSGINGLKKSAELAILNANYIASALKDYYPVLYKNKKGRVAHELILDIRPFKQNMGISEIDVAKRLIDYGFHAPTVSFPVHGTLMVEPTESESKEEIDRFVDAMISIYKEAIEVRDGKADKEDNVLKNSPHTIEEVCDDEWTHSYTRNKAAYPVKWLAEKKYWPSVARVNEAHGDRNLITTSMPIDEYRKEVMKTENI